MKTSKVCTSILLFGIGAFLAAHAAQANKRPDLDKQAHQSLQAMADASTWGHPDLYGQFTGMRAFAHGKYKTALKYFKYGARYADKLSQLSIGLLYLNGRGVKKDPATAWAWLAIAAERGYPEFVATRDRVWKQLDTAQRARAKSVRKTLAKTYGDKVAKVRMRRELQYWRTQITGSRTGFHSGVKHLVLKPAKCAHKHLLGAPIAGCGGNIYAKWRWDPKTYFAVKDARWNATVSVGALQEQASGKPDTKDDDSGK